MGFKVDSSFLKFLTMGALGVRHVAVKLRQRGFEPIELERYGSSNKIWSTKVKRLRLPDLLCVRTGTRFEVRAKSDLKIRMSDAPDNPERVWDAGLRNEDIVALIACSDNGDGPVPAENPVYFSVRDLRESVDASRLGPPKSASEGAERDREWPATVPSRPGTVESVTAERIVVMMEGDGAPARRQTYALNGKHAYVAAGDGFQGGSSIIAGVPRSQANLAVALANVYDPLPHLQSNSSLDRYAAVKALRFRTDLRAQALPCLEALLDTEQDARVVLEVAGTATALGSDKGSDRIRQTLADDARPDLSMEAIFILTELASPFAREQLRAAAARPEWQTDERRQAAVWGLGKSGLKSYEDLIPYIADPQENLAFHAIAAFGEETSQPIIDRLIVDLRSNDQRLAAASSQALSVIGSPLVLQRLVAAINAGPQSDWLFATLGRLPPHLVRANLQGSPLLQRLEPLLLLAPGGNWLSSEETMLNMAFLLKQSL